jgi:hypothetical protein
MWLKSFQPSTIEAEPLNAKTASSLAINSTVYEGQMLIRNAHPESRRRMSPGVLTCRRVDRLPRMWILCARWGLRDGWRSMGRRDGVFGPNSAQLAKGREPRPKQQQAMP